MSDDRFNTWVSERALSPLHIHCSFITSFHNNFQISSFSSKSTLPLRFHFESQISLFFQKSFCRFYHNPVAPLFILTYQIFSKLLSYSLSLSPPLQPCLTTPTHISIISCQSCPYTQLYSLAVLCFFFLYHSLPF